MSSFVYSVRASEGKSSPRSGGAVDTLAHAAEDMIVLM